MSCRNCVGLLAWFVDERSIALSSFDLLLTGNVGFWIVWLVEKALRYQGFWFVFLSGVILPLLLKSFWCNVGYSG